MELLNTAEDMHERAARRAAEQLVLLKRAKAGDDVAAAQLLFWFERFGEMDSPEVQQAIEDGSREVMSRVLAMTTIPTNTHGAPIHALHYFGVERRKTGRKATGALLEGREAFGFPLPAEALQIALTREWASKKSKAKMPPPVPREEWPETVEEVESELIAYVRHHFNDKSITDGVVRRYLRESFDWLPWDKFDDPACRNEPVTYPREWD